MTAFADPTDTADDSPVRLVSNDPTAVTPTEPARAPRGALALDQARAFYRAHFHFPTAVQLDAFTIWTAGLTHMRDHNEQFVGDTAVRLYVRAARAGAGKSLLADFIELTGGRGEVLFAPTSTYWGIVRSISEDNHTVVLDNWDMVRQNKAQATGVLIGGAYAHTARARQGRSDEPERCIFGPVAVTAIGGKLRNSAEFQPVEQRSVIIDVDRKPEDVELARFDRRDPETMARTRGIRRACADWGRNVAPEYVRYRPTDLPDGLDNRDRDMWEPLIAIADLAGGDWPARIRRACRVLVLGERLDHDEDDDPFARLTPAERTMVEASHVLRRAQGAREESVPVTTVSLLERMATLPGGRRWAVPDNGERQRILKARTMALASDLAMFGVVRSSVKVPAADGSGRYVNGWWSGDVLPNTPSDLPSFRPSDLEGDSGEEEDVPFD